ncbi:glucose 1-dehydrogenase/3-oxoacyl-[acyl-carrier protein] reductase [Streptomyces sp. Amel2xB2]|uniref:SDR family NAD(P)-dependent oxidoreductase n=1 Tax=Streptomyces sp. Amel2xB2 TaxID=1305829 RepID=UPI000DBA0A45|nr:SDR family oxidoreductase [Streptomyces sp. Amel2xB2]RAJ61637.1 glucose 1-dehydrogenase/3-oxoacyl-[acyl-carrier protein] reductase [Streptomyces sp. Amel2xB2]
MNGPHSLGLAGKRALVTGGTRGVGRATSLVLARSGARVVACYRGDEEAAKRLENELGWDAARHRTLRADLFTPAGRAAAADACRELYGDIDVLVNNMGTYAPQPFAELSDEDVAQCLDENLTAHVQLTRTVLPLLADGASVVNVGAGMAERGRPGHVHFTAAKAGLAGFVRSLSKELGDRAVRVNTVAPGVVETERGIDLPPHVREGLLSAIPLRRFGTAADVARTVAFLASDSASFVNGLTLRVDGGI